MAKIKNDKYYTSSELAKYCVEKTKEIIGEENISEFLEPSGGNGVFLDYLPQGTYSCDTEPEDGRIEEQDFLALNLEYKIGRCIIGNPPFGVKLNLAIAFYKKSILLSDYISFILPISQFNNNQQMYEFDLVYSEDLGSQKYTDRQIHCCFNIYKRNKNGFNKKHNYRFKDISIFEIRLNNKVVNNYDYAICAWGGIGKEISNPNTKQYAKEFYIKINNEKYKDKILELLRTVDWVKEYKMTATPNLLQWQVYKYLKEQIPELE